MKPFCCQQFKNLVDDMGKNGFSVVLKSGMGFMFFCLQCRPFEPEDLRKMKADGVKARILTVAQTGIGHCPSCGADLKRWIAEHADEAADLVERSRKFVLD